MNKPDTAQHRRPNVSSFSEGRWAVTCAVVAVGAVLISTASGRSHGSSTPTLQSARWAAEPAAPIVGPVSPAVADPKQCVGETLPQHVSECVAEVTVETVRRTTRTRWGGRYGP